MAYENILYAVQSGVARITLNRPDKLNSFTSAMHAELRAALDEVQADCTVRVLVLTGAGRGFCAGQDLSDPQVQFVPGETPPDMGTVVEDNAIQLKASNRIDDNLGDRVHVNTTSYNRQLLLTGEVPTQQDKQLVEKVVTGVENLRSVVNELAVMGNSTLTQRSSDALVTSRVKAQLVDAKDLYANAFKVVTERGTVYLMGRVTQREANRATEVVSRTQGVQRVVRILEIISEDDLTRMLPAAPVQK